MTDDEEIVVAFLEESRENLDRLEVDLVDLESNPSDPALLAQVFRTIHTIKGTCGFLGFRRLEALTHAGESLLGALRAGDLALDGPITSSLLALVDAVRAILGHVEATGDEGDDAYHSVIADLARHLDDERSADDASSRDSPAPAPSAAAAVAETSVRVDVAVLDKLLDLVGELVLTRSQIGDLALDNDDGPLALPYRQLRLVTRELQDGVMRARLQPIGTITGKSPRIARDLAATLGKQVRVEVEGDEVGVDKAVNEALRDPLLHLVRNGVDHGIETPTERISAGKPAEGVLRIRAFHEGGRVHVEVSDDGRGIDGDQLAARAVASGDLTAEEAAGLTTAQDLELIFSPGLSTKDEVTSVSGRGVGMDVVKASLEQVGGSIDVSSAPGIGSVFRINVPLTLAIMPALVVWCGGSRYVVPQVDVQEIVQLDADLTAAMDDVDGVRLHRLRGRLLPLVELARHLRVPALGADEGSAIVVIRNGGRRFGLVVDDVADTIEAVVKPLTRAVRSVPVFTGVTILSDGQPSLVLDLADLASAAVEARADDDLDHVETSSPSASLLLATGTNGARLAFHLSAVERLEQFQPDRVEYSGSAEVVQYGDVIVPLIRLGATGEAADAANSVGPLAAVVCASSAGPVALIVDRIDDVVGKPAATEQPAIREGAAACLVVGGHVTELIDVEALVAAAGLARSA